MISSLECNKFIIKQMATNRDIIVYSTFALAILMLLWCSGLLVFNGPMLFDCINNKPSLFSTTIFCYLSFVIISQILYFLFSLFVLIDHMHILNSVDHISLFPKSYRTDIKVIIIIIDYVIIAGMVSALIYAFGNMGTQAAVSMIIAYLYPILTSVLDFYYLQTLPSNELKEDAELVEYISVVNINETACFSYGKGLSLAPAGLSPCAC